MAMPTYTLFVHLLAAIALGTLAGSQDIRDMVARDSAAARTWNLRNWYQGKDFLDKWTYFNLPDPTGGNVNYLSKGDAIEKGLAYVDVDGTFVLAVDDTSNVPPGGNRNSVRIQSEETYTGALIVLDLAAMPVGCAVWPAFWTVGPDWPTYGEIDIIEGVNPVNNRSRNQMTLHSGTQYPCTLNETSSKTTFTGQVLSTNCYSTPDSDSGCSIADTDSCSFGPEFNAVGGGMFVFLWDVDISIWHFAREDIPLDIFIGTPTPSSEWGTPAGFWSGKTCNTTANFRDHTLVFDTTICGGWAASAYSRSGCPGTCSDMVANATNFADAKWKINYLAIYQ